jgi:hypothetical protein
LASFACHFDFDLPWFLQAKLTRLSPESFGLIAQETLSGIGSFAHFFTAKSLASGCGGGE